MEPRIYTAPGPFELETGHTLPELRIAYHTYGTLNAAKDNVAWVCHALTANSDVADWWPHTVEAGGGSSTLRAISSSAPTSSGRTTARRDPYM